MSITWRLVVRIFNSEGFIGSMELPHQTTEVLPRAREIVGFEESEHCEALKLGYHLAALPSVLEVQHEIGRAGSSVAVHIKMETSRSLEQTDELAKRNGIRWSPDAPSFRS